MGPAAGAETGMTAMTECTHIEHCSLVPGKQNLWGTVEPPANMQLEGLDHTFIKASDKASVPLASCQEHSMEPAGRAML